ncbi:MAG: hypothetical protein V1921_02120 [Candidatus Altiarchaeota archaeon]
MGGIIEEDMTYWLDLTHQQLNVLKAIKALELRDEQTTPKNINLEYDQSYGGIHYSNLFNQLKLLQGRGLVLKTGRASYALSIGGMENTISEQKKKINLQLEGIEAFRGNIEDYLTRISTREDIPTARYLDHKSFYKKIVELTNKSRMMSTNILWPAISHTHTIYSKTGRTEYVEAVRRRCFEEKSLAYRYITPLDIEYPYALAMNVYQNREMAYKECLTTIDIMEQQARMYDTLEIYYLDKPFELDMVIPVIHDKPHEVLMVIRAPLMSGIYIYSKEIAQDFQQLFEKMVADCKLVRGSFATKLFKSLRRRAKDRFGPKNR